MEIVLGSDPVGSDPNAVHYGQAPSATDPAASGVRHRRSRASPGGSWCRRGSRVTIELEGMVVFGHHGYLEEERRLGQRFLVDLLVDVSEEAA